MGSLRLVSDSYLGRKTQLIWWERRQMLCHLFHQIDWVFRPNGESGTNRKDPIYLNKLGQEDGA